jgi:hypothetical protein
MILAKLVECGGPAPLYAWQNGLHKNGMILRKAKLHTPHCITAEMDQISLRSGFPNLVPLSRVFCGLLNR